MNDKNKICDSDIERIATFIRQQLRTEQHDSNRRVAINESHIYIGSSKQTVRLDNQDRVVCAHISNSKAKFEIAIVVIADGMGGLEHGGLAATDAISYFVAFIATSCWRLEAEECVTDATFYADSMLYKKYNRRSGSTISGIVYFPSFSISINIGDSRIYLIKNKTLKQISTDDSPSKLLNTINNSKSELSCIYENLDSRLTQHIGIGEGIIPHIVRYDNKDEKFDSFLLTTDGLHFIHKDLLTALIEKSPNHEELTRRCLCLSDWLGGHDNATIALAPQKIHLKAIDTSQYGVKIDLVSTTKRFSVYSDFIETHQTDLLQSDLTNEKKIPLISNDTPKNKKKGEKEGGKRKKSQKKNEEPNGMITIFYNQGTSDEL